MSGPGKSRALGALVLGGVFLGCSPILVRVSHVGPIATAFWRLALALVPLAPLFARASRDAADDHIPASPADHLTASLPGLCLAGDLVAWHISLHMTTVTKIGRAHV